jgi:hypothetical protein
MLGPFSERDARHLGPYGHGTWRRGKDLDVKAGREAAYTAALNVLALTKKQLGSLNRVSHVVRLGVYVAATSEFTEHAKDEEERRALRAGAVAFLRKPVGKDALLHVLHGILEKPTGGGGNSDDDSSR